MSLGEKIKALREEQNISQLELANKLNVNSSMVISNWENSKSKPDTEKLLQICELLNCPLSYFFPDYECLNANNLTLEEEDMFRCYRVLDSIGQKEVKEVLEKQYERCQRKDSCIAGDSNSDAEIVPVSEPIFLKKTDAKFLEMKGKIAELQKLNQQSSIRIDMMISVLHAKGYNKLISIADIVMLLKGLKVPSEKLYEDVKMILEWGISKQ